jgi:hypothetical protein
VRVGHRVALAPGDHDLAATVVARAAAPLDEGGDSLLQVVATGEREPTVRVVLADRSAGRLGGLGRRRNVGVEVLEATSGSSPASAATKSMLKPGNVVQTLDAHETATLTRITQRCG